jgi:Rrf2 family cysteine metabolism transcriptional repressor
MAIRISKKCYYALRAVFELALRDSVDPVTVQEIASVQDMPARFLEAILNELRQAGIVVSHRGNAGGYLLAKPPDKTTVAEVIEVIQGPISIAKMPDRTHGARMYFCGDAALERLWQCMNDSIAGVCLETSFADLVAWEKSSKRTAVPDYSI